MRTHAVTSLRMFTREDPWVNVLRSTLAAFGASVGGADAITVLPYDTVLGLPERLGRRLARNTQILLADESNVGRVTDPGGGSWYLESLTDQVADAVWSRFQEVERAGGAVQALADGLLHRWVEQACAERDRQIATRQPPAHRGVDVPRRRARQPATRRARAACHGRRARPGTAPRRDGVREAARPGHDRWATPASSSNAGHPARVRRPAGLRHQPARRRPASGPPTTGSPVAVLASSPKGYADARRGRGGRPARRRVERVLVAGRASELGDAADQVDGEVHDGMDVVAFLSDLLDRLGAPPDPATAATTTTSTEGSR